MKRYAETLQSAESDQIRSLYDARRAQADQDVELVKELLPEGTVIRVQLGNALVDLKINRHGCPWIDPFEIGGVNIETGKQRSFHATDVFSVIDKPVPTGGLK